LSKETRLKDFYNFPALSDSNGGQSSWSDEHRDHIRRALTKSWPKEVLPSRESRRQQLRAVNVMALLMVTTSVALYFQLFRWAAVTALVVYVSSNAGGGFDNLELALHYDQIIATNHDR
jgi:hypothetical protein